MMTVLCVAEKWCMRMPMSDLLAGSKLEKPVGYSFYSKVFQNHPSRI